MKRIIKHIFILDKSQWMDSENAIGVIHTKTNQYFLMLFSTPNIIGKAYKPTHIIIENNTMKLWDKVMELSLGRQDVNEISFIKFTELLLKGVYKTHTIKL